MPYFFFSIKLPTVNELMFDYNPYYRCFQFCTNCSKRCLAWAYGIAHRNIKFVPEARDLLYMAEDTAANTFGFIMTRLLGYQVVKVTPQDCQCDAPSAISGKARYLFIGFILCVISGLYQDNPEIDQR